MPRLSVLRKRRLLSQRELARRAGVAPSSVHLIESGGVTPRYVVMRKILNALELGDPMEVDEFRHATLGEGDEAEADAGYELTAVTDPVLAELWDNPEDDVYDRLARK